MILATRNTQSLTDFRQNANETLDRLDSTGEAEIITVNGHARAVLLSPARYDELVREALLAHDVASIRESVKDIEAGRVVSVDEVSAHLRRGLKARKSKSRKVAE